MSSPRLAMFPSSVHGESMHLTRLDDGSLKVDLSLTGEDIAISVSVCTKALNKRLSDVQFEALELVQEMVSARMNGIRSEVQHSADEQLALNRRF